MSELPYQEMKLRVHRKLLESVDLLALSSLDSAQAETHVRSALLDHFQHRVEYTQHGPVRPVLALGKAAQAVEMPEQLVCAVYEMNDHASLCRGIGLRSRAVEVSA